MKRTVQCVYFYLLYRYIFTYYKLPSYFYLKTVRAASNDLWIRDMVADYELHKKTRGNLASDGENYARSNLAR